VPFQPPLKRSQPHPKIKRTAGKPPGAGPIRKVKLATRDPRRRGG
jgi:hypothetical protein